ncbi:MAG: domain S-box [Gemmatimonadetes bacterium]|nr:domain S-box [Gemmatimonadota bacterium]
MTDAVHPPDAPPRKLRGDPSDPHSGADALDPLARLAPLARRALAGADACVALAGGPRFYCADAAGQPGTAAALDAAVDRVLAGGREARAEGEGGVAMAVPVTDADGKVAGAVAAADGPGRAWSEDDACALREVADAAAAVLALERGAEARARALVRGEERYRFLAETVPAQIWTAQPDGALDFVSAATAAYFGYTRERLLGEGWQHVVHPDDLPAVARRWARSLHRGASYEVEFRLRRHDGAWRWHLGRAEAMRGPGGEIVGWFGVNTDVDDLRRVERALRRSEAAYSRLADAIPQIVWTTTPDGYHDYFNARWYEYTGMSREGGQGWNWKDFLHPDDYERTLEVWSRSLRTGESYETRYRFRRAADGAYRWFIARALPERDGDGAVVRWFGTCTDVHDQSLAEAERDRLIATLETERARLHELFMQAPALIAVLRGPDHVFELANPPYRALFGGRELVGRPARDAIPEVGRQGYFDRLDGVYATGKAFLGNEMYAEVDRGRGAPEAAYFNLVFHPLREVDGGVGGVLIHAVEVTEQVRTRREIEANAEELARTAAALEASNRELDQFAYVASHDLKAPLRGIANLSQWIEEDLAEHVTDEVRGHLELLRGRVHRMEGLIDGILQYSRAARVREKPERVEVGGLLDETLDLMAPPPEVQIRVQPGMPTVLAERLPLQQVFMNLVGNAVKHNRRPGAEVRVEWRDAGPAWEFAVADNGAGIAPEYHARIFGIFQTLEARDKVEGTGIGLSLVKKIVESRGGRVWVESREGAGATFRFTLRKPRPSDADDE